ncbi:pregnancy-specific beta-1-glycoprotein 2-like [Saccostrea cucullata]|uniref:pregnancy-specific beta-1-glycoprotein 2-like n=1 Tax=Saccostrea cuccullata TaxID=36930 RepID=UPI002ED14532
MQYNSVKIQVREYKGPGYIEGHTDYIKTYNVNKVESNEGDSRNISLTINALPASGIYGIFHSARNGLYSKIIHINGRRVLVQTEKYMYHSRPSNSTDIIFEVRNITLADAGHYVVGLTKSLALSEGEDAVLVVNGKPTTPVINGSNLINVNTKAILDCESKSTSAPYYYKFPPLSYSWFVNKTKIYREVRETYSFKVTKDAKYNQYSCEAKEILVSERSEEIRINPLYGPESLKITPNQQNDDLSLFDGETFGPYTCSADCNPPCTVQWKYKHPAGGFRDATPNRTSAVNLPVQTAKKTSMALIRCVVTGIEGRKTSDITLNIYCKYNYNNVLNLAKCKGY